ncbi:unnamed protein product [Durusdinium trenchii]|uniref:Uncharacterized protein n=1 Tax=Durusdinium trenchii TaxID=1381693 RepID=A0ABP0RTW2_9DINO
MARPLAGSPAFCSRSQGYKSSEAYESGYTSLENTTCETEQEAYVSSLEQSLEEVGTDHVCQIRSIFQRAVAALSPPRYCTMDSWSQPAGPRREVQVRLRKVVLTCLGSLDLDDSKVQPALRFLRSRRFRSLTLKTTRLVARSSGTCKESSLACPLRVQRRTLEDLEVG